ncbi:MAG: amino acid permease [Spirochaetaceae bacterium]|nr:MAG: amino acid permease [Spirochaetaceae bacterium]
MRVNRFDPFTFAGAPGIFATAGFVFVSYGGLLHIASVAEEIHNPKKNIPLGMILALIIVGIAYSFVVVVTVGVLDGENLAGSLTPITDGALEVLGPGGMIALSVAAILAFVSTANAGLLSSSRYLFALGRDQLLPDCFTRINKRFSTPHWAILVTGAFMIAVLFLPLETLVQSASTVLMLTYILSNLSVIVLRESRIVTYKPSFRSPLYPWLQIIGSVAFSLLIFQMGLHSMIITLGLVSAGFLVYLLYGKRRTDSEFALMHIVQRVFNELPFLENRRITSNLLESELRHIIHDRDEVIEDEFDRLVHASLVIDIPEMQERDEFFRMVARAAAPQIGISAQEIESLLKEREQLSSTVLSTFLAVPHIVIPGREKLIVVVARARMGIRFHDSGEGSSVKAVFAIFGTLERRNLHLKVLSSIAQIACNEAFERLWIDARTEEDLRSILLLGERRRVPK